MVWISGTRVLAIWFDQRLIRHALTLLVPSRSETKRDREKYKRYGVFSFVSLLDTTENKRDHKMSSL